MEITSRDNPLVKELRQLLSSSRMRRKSGRFVIEGARLCEDAARSGVRITAALSTEEARSRYAAQWGTVRTAARAVYGLSCALMEQLSDTGSPQGILCLCETPQEVPLCVKANGVYLALENLQDPGNLGTVIRTAEALGADGLLLSRDCCDLYSPKVLRASMGGVFRMPFEVCDELPKRLVKLGELLPTLACVVDGDALPVTHAPKNGAVAVIGNEGNGLSEQTAAACTARVTVPMAGRAESLNASMAAGIVLWELCRQRGTEG